MSLLISLKNGDGKQIHSIHIKNMRPIGDGKYFYHIEYFEHDQEKRTLNFDIIHNRDNGASGLMLLVYEKINEITKNEHTILY